MPNANALTVVPVVIDLVDEWLGFDPRHISSETLSIKIGSVPPGSSIQIVLLRERQRRRELCAKIAQRAQP